MNINHFHPSGASASPLEDKNVNSIKNEPHRKSNAEYAVQVLDKMPSILKYSGIAALITAFASVFFLVKEDNDKTKKLGDYLGNCYVIIEAILIVAIITAIGLKIFISIKK